MRHLTILVDMDDTIENLAEAWVAYLNARHQTSTNLSDITDWDISKAFPIVRSEDTKCMCKEFREMEEGTCHCGLYIKIKDKPAAENVDRCICCGAVIPEGRMVCPNCGE